MCKHRLRHIFYLFVVALSPTVQASNYISAQQYFGYAPNDFTSASAYGQWLCQNPNGWGFIGLEPWPTVPGNYNARCDDPDYAYDRYIPFSTRYRCPDPTKYNLSGMKCIVNFAEDDRMAGEPEMCDANPVNVATGKKFERVVDWAHTKSPLLSVTRTYSNNKWHFNFDREIAGTFINSESDGIAGPVIYNYKRKDGKWLRQSDGFSFTEGFSISPAYGFAASYPEERIYEVSLPDGSVERFDVNVRILDIANRSGDVVTYTWDVPNYHLSITSNRGDIVNIQYSLIQVDSFPEPYTVRVYDQINVNGSSIYYEYNDQGLITSVIYPDNSTVQYKYTDGRLTKAIDENNNASTWTYNGEGLVATSVKAGGIDSHTFSYTNFNSTDYQGTVSVTDSLGRVTNYKYRRIGGVRKIIEVTGDASLNCPEYSRSSSYDSSTAALSEQLDWKGNKTSYIRDEKLRETSRTEAVGTEVERTIATTYADTYNNISSVEYPRSKSIMTYNDNGALIQQQIIDTETNESRTTIFTRDSDSKLLSVDGPRTDVSDVTSYTYHDCTSAARCDRVASITNSLGHIVSVPDYNSDGLPIRIVDANLVETVLSYDLRQRLTAVTVDGSTTQFDYDAAGNVTRVTQADGVFHQYDYDVANQLIAVSDSQGNRISWILDTAGNRVVEEIFDSSGQIKKQQQRTYDEISRLIALTHAHGGQDRFEYDPNNNLVKTIDAANRETLQGFDPLNRLVSIQDANLGQTLFAYDSHDNLTSATDSVGKTTSYTYNGFGERTSRNSPDTGLTSYTYDAAGNLQSRTDARGITEQYTYDSLNRITSVSYPSAVENLTYIYDNGVNGIGRVSSISDQTGSTAFSYDARGNITQVAQSIGTHLYTTAYQYNEADRIIRMTNPSERQINYTYDASGRIRAVTSTFEGESENLATGIARLPFGPMSGMTLGNGIASSKNYDLDYRIQNIDHGLVLQRNYAFSAVDNITAITDSIDAGQSQLFDYDALDRLTFAAGGYGEQSFSYDGIGNRLSLEVVSDGVSVTKDYQYEPESHRLSQIVGERAFSYDAVGNTINNGIATFNYNDRNRMSTATANGVTTSYEFDAQGQRVSKTSSIDTTHYIYDLDGRLIAEGTDTGDVLVEYAYLDGEPLAMWRLEGPESTVPKVVTPRSPIGAVTTASPNYVWDDEGTSDEYQVIIYDRYLRASVYNERHDSADLCSNGSCAIAPSGITMNFNTNHFWRVRGRNAQGWGEWTDQLRFDYLDDIPGPITPITPIASTNIATPTYEWQDLGNAIEYQVLIYDRFLTSTVYNERLPVPDVCSAGRCSVTPDLSLNFNAKHFWRIRARNSGGWNDWTDQIQFDYLDEVPGAITPVAPLGEITDAIPNYEWQDLGNAIEYQVLIYDRFLGTSIYNERHNGSDICAAGSCSIAPGITMNFNANHFWRVRARNSGGWNEWTGQIRFDYLDTPPVAPTPIGPTDTQTIADPTYQWEPVTNALEYQLIVRDQALGTLIYNERHFSDAICTTVECAVTPGTATLSEGSNHFWRVRGRNSGGWGEWVPVQRFNVDTGGQ